MTCWVSDTKDNFERTGATPSTNHHLVVVGWDTLDDPVCYVVRGILLLVVSPRQLDLRSQARPRVVQTTPTRKNRIQFNMSVLEAPGANPGAMFVGGAYRQAPCGQPKRAT